MRLNQRRAEYEQKLLDVGFEVQSAYEQLEESRHTVELYSARFVPIAEQSLAAARTNYEAGKETFLELLAAQRRHVEVRDMQQQARAMLRRRRAELDRAIGRLPVEHFSVIQPAR